MNVLYGRKVSDISNAAECSPYKGSLSNSGTLVEANRGYNISLSQDDINACKNYLGSGKVNTPEKMSVGYWAGNTPLNLNTDSLA